MSARQVNAAPDRILIGISSCLLGQAVRYDSGHKHNAYITQSLGRYFDFVPFCPEVAIGLGVPRLPIRLVQVNGEVRVRGVQNPDHDVTEALVAYGQQVAERLSDVSGYLFKKGSPSCGMERVKIYSPAGMPVASGAGAFARTLMQNCPELPLEEEGRLMDPVLRENFVERVFVYHRWRTLSRGGVSAAELVEFHTRHKFLVLAHDEPAYRELGQLVAQAGAAAQNDIPARYIRLLMQALKRPATTRQHANVLMHIMGYLKRALASSDKAEVLDLIDAYRRGKLPLIVPITLLRHHLRHYPNEYVLRQYYLDPHPDELMLRNHI
jgi:uncharacterized protein YbgA (DUF1722 family)/uncharacterized protein YbbK (DUF523 family)